MPKVRFFNLSDDFQSSTRCKLKKVFLRFYSHRLLLQNWWRILSRDRGKTLKWGVRRWKTSDISCWRSSASDWLSLDQDDDEKFPNWIKNFWGVFSFYWDVKWMNFSICSELIQRDGRESCNKVSPITYQFVTELAFCAEVKWIHFQVRQEKFLKVFLPFSPYRLKLILVINVVSFVYFWNLYW